MSEITVPVLPESAWRVRPGTPLTRLLARFTPWRLDRQLVDGAIAEPDSALAVHVARLTSELERRQLAAALRFARREARLEPTLFNSRIPLEADTITRAGTAIDDVIAVLEAPRPVRAHGVARLRMLMSDGVGPFYAPGDLAGALRTVLAEL